MEESKFKCIKCNYNTSCASDWIKHVDTAKHKRNGQKLPKNCSECDYIGLNHWNLKMHLVINHYTKEQRTLEKYYCYDCDQVFFCSEYMKKHMNGKKHSNMVLANKLYNDTLNNL